MSEATLLWVVKDFFRSPVKDSFLAQQLNTLPEAVHLLLVTFAAEAQLDSAVRRLQTTSQGSTKNVGQFGLRLQLEAAALGSLLDATEVKSLFAQGLKKPKRSLFAAHQPSAELEDTSPLSDLIGRATILENGTRSVQTTPRMPFRYYDVRNPVFSAPADTQIPLHCDDGDSESVLLLALRSMNHSSEKWTCYVCFRQGHGWIDCSWLKGVSTEKKEEALLRRRAHFDRSRSKSPARDFSATGSTWTTTPRNTTDSRDTPPPSPKNVLTSPRQYPDLGETPKKTFRRTRNKTFWILLRNCSNCMSVWPLWKSLQS
jgi:hypothetical protein